MGRLVLAADGVLLLVIGLLRRTMSGLCIGQDSPFPVYHQKRVIDGPETNYITATLALYQDIYNVFPSLLTLLGNFGGESD